MNISLLLIRKLCKYYWKIGLVVFLDYYLVGLWKQMSSVHGKLLLQMESKYSLRGENFIKLEDMSDHHLQKMITSLHKIL